MCTTKKNMYASSFLYLKRNMFRLMNKKKITHIALYIIMNRDMRFLTMWYVRPAKAQISLRKCAQSDQNLCKWLEYSRSVNLLTKYHLEFLSLKGGCTGSSESTLVKMQQTRMLFWSYVKYSQRSSLEYYYNICLF